MSWEGFVSGGGPGQVRASGGGQVHQPQDMCAGQHPEVQVTVTVG